MKQVQATDEGSASGAPAEEALLMAAANAGLFPPPARADSGNQAEAKEGTAPLQLERRGYRIRIARDTDIAALEHLERVCWPSRLQTSRERLLARLQSYPDGQLALVLDEQVVAVVYSQRTSTDVDLTGATMWTAEKLHRADGAQVFLLGICVLPELQHRNFGSELLEFILQRSALLPGVERVVGVTRCKDYPSHAQAEPADFIRLRNELGSLIDTTLRFHELHGAEIAGLVPNYRPEDEENRGYGVLVRYDLAKRRPAARSVTSAATKSVPTDKASVTRFVRSVADGLLKKGSNRDRALSLTRPLMDMGLDSGDVLELRERINHHYGLSIETEFFFDHNTLAKVIDALQRRMADVTAQAAPAIQAAAPTVARQPETKSIRAEDIAVIGMALRLPGGVHDAESFWEMLSSERFAVGRAPADRFVWPDGIAPDGEHRGIDRGGFLDDVAGFDAEFFRISRKEAELMDPQQRLLMELSWECLEHAGYPSEALGGSRTGVFVGASGSDYGKLLAEAGIETEAHTGLGASMAIVPNRISYFFDFCGPSLLIDTACSSSLVAVHAAVKALRGGECEQALVGGVNVLCHAPGSVTYYKAGMLSVDGCCKSFDADANGYVRAEGAGMVLLKPLARALADGDNIRAVIKGSAVNHGGRANGLTVPQPKKQAALVVAALHDAAVDAATVGYIEAHGSATHLGDPIEISGLKQAFAELAPSQRADPPRHCGVGSVKSNLGHLEAAAGVVGLIKVVLALEHRTIPASLHFKRLNPHISLEGSPFYIAAERSAWSAPAGSGVRRAGVSSFGSGGANAHVVLEEAPATVSARPSLPRHAFTRQRYWALDRKIPRVQKPSRAASSATLWHPVWQEAERETKPALPPRSLERHIILCDTGRLPSDIPPRTSDGVPVSVFQSDAPLVERRFCDYAERLLEFSRDRMRSATGPRTLVQLVVPHEGDGALLSGLSGALKTLQAENPSVLGQIIAVADASTAGSLFEKIAVAGRHPNEPVVRFREEAILVQRWMPTDRAMAGSKRPWKGDGVYLIVGGAGGLGRIFAREIQAHAKTATVIVAGRSASAPQLKPGVAYRQVDLTSEAEVGECVRGVAEQFGRLDGVIHCAGVLRDSLALKKTARELREVFGAKVVGTANLARAVGALKQAPDFFILFGSTSGVLGNVGQFDYAAANAYQDNFAAAHPEIAQRVLAIDWPLWRDGGMSVDAATEAALREQWGAVPLETDAALEAFYQAYDSNERQVLVWNGTPAKIAELPRKVAAFAEVAPVVAPNPASGGDLIQRLKVILSEVIGTDAAEIDVRKSFDAYGVDSILMTELSRKLGVIFPEMSRTLLYQHDTVTALAGFLASHCPAECARWTGQATALSTAATEASPSAVQAESEPAAASSADSPEPIAIIGLSVRFPGANDLEAFWRLLKSGSVSIAEGPIGRWPAQSAEATTGSQRAAKWGGFLTEPYLFDPLFFGMTPREAENTDPQERLFLEECWKAMEDAGWSVTDLPAEVRKKTAVFGAITKQGYNLTPSESRLPVTSFASLANRVSYHFDLQGPSMPVDTMCSSALVALHHACEYLRGGGELALVGGVNLYLHPSNLAKLATDQLVSGTERSDPFGKAGDGFVPGEGVGALVLKPLSKAQRDGDAIYALIRGTAVNHGGKSANYTAPSTRQQVAVIQDALENAKVSAESIGYLESAANGSQTGDAVEAAAISKVFGERTPTGSNRHMGSVKPNIGHPESASGIAQIAKVVLALQHRLLPPTVLSEGFEPCVPLERMPFQLVRRPEAWTPLTIDGASCPRRAGITGVGAGGVNAHVVVEEYIASTPAPRVASDDSVAFVLSAKTPESLTAYLTAWVDYLEKHPDADLVRLAYLVQVGRSAMPCRWATNAVSVHDLVLKLRAAHTEEVKPVSSRPSATEEIQRAVENRDTETLVRLWLQGGDVPWHKLYTESKIQRLHGLPVYPFLRRDCSIEAIATASSQLPPVPKTAASEPPANRAIEFYSAWAQNSSSAQREDFLTFCPFEQRLPGFSMSRAFLFPEKYRGEWELMKRKQIELRQVLFYEENFSRLEAVFDIGCGYGSDVIGMAETYPQLRADGFSLTGDQVKVANARIAQAGLGQRVRVFQRDSSAATYPGTYDFVMGIEVTFHIREKDRLFRNIVGALRAGGRVLLMDFVTNLRGAIVEPNLEISIPTKREWVELLSRHGLLLTSVIDVSPQIANFLHDPEYREVTKDLPELVQQTFQNYANQSQSLERGWVSYCLLKIEKMGAADYAELCRRNHERLSHPTSYPEALAAMHAQGPAPYPRSANAPTMSRSGTGVPPVVELKHGQDARATLPVNSPDHGRDLRATLPAVKDELLTLCAKELGFRRAELSAESTFRDLSVGSVEATRLTQAVNERFDLELPTSVILECRTLGDFAGAIAARNVELGRVASSRDAAPSASAPVTAARLPTIVAAPRRPEPPLAERGDVAVIGLSLRCAGANGPDQFWELIREGREGVASIEDPRWLDTLRRNLPAGAEFRRGMLEDPQGFDAPFFNISPKEAALMDVSQRLILEETYKALEDAGYTSERLQRATVGTFVGTSGTNTDPHETSHFSLLGTDASVMASRIAYYLDLKGPAVAVNAACASSFAAVDLAIQKLNRGEIDLAIAGGVAVFDDPLTTVRLHKAGLLSLKGKCRPFDAEADGFVLGDGVGVVILKRLADAERDGDPIYGVIRGIGSNHNGQTLGLTVPSASAQCELLQGLYARHGVATSDIQYIESNGTATKLGDSIEFGALAKTYAAGAPKKQSCVVGALKANIGNCGAASGALALIKVLLCLKNRQLPPIAGFSRYGEELNFAQSPFRVEQTATPWPSNERGPRLAAISSFGFNGTNYHLVLAEHPAETRARHSPVSSDLLLLSAETPAQLHRLADAMGRYIAHHVEVALEDILFTLRTGRRFHAHRLAIVTTDRDSLMCDLENAAKGEIADDGRIYTTQPGSAGFCLDDTPEGAEFLTKLAQGGRLNKLAELWVNGTPIDWSTLPIGGAARRVSGLPAYPFARAAVDVAVNEACTGSGMSEEASPLSPWVEVLTSSLGRCLSLAPNQIPLDRPFQKLGLDSIVAGEWTGELNRRHGIVVSLQSLYEHASIRGLAAWLETQGYAQPSATPPEQNQRGSSVPDLAPIPTPRPQPAGYTLRQAALSDLDTWTRLEKALGPESLATPVDVLRERIENNPDGNFLVERNGQPAGLICFQRVKSTSHLRAVSFDKLASVRSANGGDVLQLVTFELLPEWRDIGLSGELLEWVLNHGKSLAGITTVVHIARCHGFAGRSESEFGKYLLEHDRRGFAAEPVLREHRERGGRVQGVLVNYRSTDRANLGLGVWVQHDLQPSTSRVVSPDAAAHAEDAGAIMKRLSPLMKTHPEIVPLAMQGGGPTTFWIHPMSGEVGVYYKLAGRISGELRMIGLQARGFLRPDQTPLDSMAELARHYADLVTAIQPVGPYHLAGFSFGGTIAHEVVRELQSRGARAGSLVLVEAPFVSNEVAELATMTRRSALVMNANFLVLALLTTDSKVAAAMRSGATDWTQYRVADEAVATVAEDDLPDFLAAHCRRCGVSQSAEIVKQKLLTMTAVHLANLRAVQTYRTTPLARPTEVRCLLLRTREAIATSKLVLNPPYLEEIQRRHSSMTSVLAGWTSVLPQATAVLLEGANHFELFHDDASVLAVSDALRSFYRSWPDEKPAMRNGAHANDAKPKAAASAIELRDTPHRRQTGVIAVVGISGRFPEAADVDAFWTNLKTGKSSVKEVPSDRGWRIDDYFDPRPQRPGKTYCRRGAFLENVDCFDPLFFGISPIEAELMDPSERLFLQEAWRAIENAGYAPGQLKRRKWGVFACVKGDYATLVQKYHPTFLAATDSSPPARLSYTLDLSGPAISVDTACSSALAAVAHACDSLTLKHCDAAVVGAGGVYATPNMLVTSSQSLLFSPDGECYTFDERANGTVLGEAVGVVVLKRLEDAVADRDPIYGVIRGWGTNQNGRTNGLTAPSALSQAALQADVYHRHGIDPGRITMVEAHGTGTKLGDPVEYQALCESFARYTQKQRYCALGSLKTNIGHPFAAAGIAGLIKVLLSLKHRQIPASLNFQKLNSFIADRRSPFFVNTSLRPWDTEDDEPRLAAINSFGATGINVHLVVEEHRAEEVSHTATTSAGTTPVVIVMSAKDRARLQDGARALLDWIRRERTARLCPSLHEIAYTLQIARDAMEARLAFVAASLDELEAGLNQFIDNRDGPIRLYRGEVKPSRSSASAVNAAKSTPEPESNGRPTVAALETLVERWINGGTVSWESLYAESKPRRSHLPGYVFAKDRYWVGGALAPAVAPANTSGEASVLHPLVHRNTSVLEQQRYTSFFSGDEFFLRDHVVNGEKLLPGVAYLEMAREAAVRAMPGRSADARHRLRLKNVVWLRPFAVGGEGRELHVRLASRGTEEIGFEIYSGSLEAADAAALHSQGSIEYRELLAMPAQIDLRALGARCRRLTVTADECYAAFKANGVDYGDGHRGVETINVGEDASGRVEVLAKLELPASVASDSERFQLHPSLLDSALQAAIGLAYAEGASAAQKRLSLPFALEALEIFGTCVPKMWAHIRRVQSATASDAVEKLDIDLCDNDGHVLVQMRGFSSKVVHLSGATAHSGAAENLATMLFAPSWRDVKKHGDATGVWSVICLRAVGEAERPEPATASANVSWLEYDEADSADLFSRLALEVFGRIQALLRENRNDRIFLQIATLRHGKGQLLSALSALLLTAEKENPRFIGQMVQFEAQQWPSNLVERLANWRACSHDKQIRDDGAGGAALDWKPLLVTDADAKPIWRDGGVYLITGGAGGLGLLFAHEIARHAKQPTIVLAGRSAPDAVEPRLRPLRESGATVNYRQVDIADRAAVDRLVRAIVAEHGALHGVLHAAGLVRDKLIVNKTPEDFAAVLAPKVLGTTNLDEATKEIALDLFVLFSSGASVLGNAGQADYAAANAFMDRYAAFRQEWVAAGTRQGRTLAINWPLWEEGGMRVSAEAVAGMTRTLGIVPLRTASGMRAFYQACRASAAQILVLEGDPNRALKTAIAGGTEDATAPKSATGTMGEATPEADDALREAAVDYFRTIVAAMLKLPAHRIERTATFETYGIDSILATSFINQLEEKFGSLPKTLFFEYQHVEALADYFLAKYRDRTAELVGPPKPQAASLRKNAVVQVAAVPMAIRPPAITAPTNAVAAAERKTAKTEDIAIIALAGRFPGARTIAEFWENLKAGKDGVTEIPPDRWDHREHFDPDKSKYGKAYSKWGGFIEGVDQFDPLFFNLAPQTAALIDPKERLFLETVWELFESAGLTRDTIDQRHAGSVGVFVGAMYQEYHGFDSSWINESIVSLSSYSSIANRVSHFFNLRGPSVAIDTMCSSTLSAIKMACDSLIRGDCEMAVAGGANLSLHPKKYVGLSLGRMIGSHPDSRSFSDGDGYIPAETVGAFLLKPLSKAIHDGDRIAAVIKSVHLNHDGRSNGYAIPNPRAQAKLMQENFHRTGIDPRTIGYVEAAANGSALGDPIELAALKSAFGEFTSDRNFCALGAVKSNFGHAEAASGVAQLAKVVLQLQHGEFVPSIKAERLNPSLSFADSPFYLQRENAPWPRRRTVENGQEIEWPRRACVSSFGAGGSNAHLIVEEYIPADASPDRRAPTAAPQVIVFSARNAGRLRALVERMLSYLERTPDVSLADFAYTLQLGREAMECRLALVAPTSEALRATLREWLTSASGPTEKSGWAGTAIYGGDINAADDSQLSQLASGRAGATWVQTLIEEGDLEKLALIWAKGGTIPWRDLPRDEKPRLIALPTYPFERRRCWIEEATGSKAAPSQLAVSNETTVVSGSNTLAETLGKLLGVDPKDLNPDQPLEHYGVDSILFTQLAQYIQAEVDPNISLGELKSRRTLRELQAVWPDAASRSRPGALVKARENAAPFRELIQLGKGEEPPVFWFHAGVGGVEAYQAIAAKSRRTFYGIQARGWMNDDQPLQGIPSLADHYARIVQAVQPAGPYDLGGYSMGGALAYEVTRRLQEAGQTVRSIVMLDTLDGAGVGKVRPRSDALYLQVVNTLLASAGAGGSDGLARRLIHRDEMPAGMTESAFLDRLISLARQRGSSKSESHLRALVGQMAAVQRAYDYENFAIVALPRPQEVTCYYVRNANGVFLGPLAPYFTLADAELDRSDHWQEWQRYLPNFRRIDVPSSSHMTLLMEPEPLAAILEVCSQLYSDTACCETPVR